MAEQQQRQGIALLVTLAVAGAGWWWYAARPTGQLTAAPLPADTVAAVAVAPATCTAIIEGEVANPGRYALPVGTTLQAALAAAGGATPAARLADFDVNAKISSDTRIYIPPRLTDGRFTSGATLTDRDLIHLPRPAVRAPAPAAAPGAPGGDVAPAEPVNLNTATREQLMTLPRIGPKTADAILEYRARVGALHSLEELRNIPRIGDKTIAAFRDRVTF